MLTLSDIVTLETHDQFFSYADPYLSASATLCRQMENDDTRYTWPHATVILMLAAHAVELFLKGALLKRKVDIISFKHDIQKLAEEYRVVFTDESLKWDDIPFASHLSETELTAQMKQQWPDIDEVKLKTFITSAPYPSILYRYPVNKPGQQWRGCYGFTTPGEFLTTLDQLGRDFNRLKMELAKLPGLSHG